MVAISNVGNGGKKKEKKKKKSKILSEAAA